MILKNKNMKHNASQELEYSYITDGIYVGTNQCCMVGFAEVLIDKEKIEADMSMEAERIDSAFGVDYFVWLPVVDHAAPKLEQLEFGVEVLNKWVSMKKKIYIHCQNGHGRAPTMVAAYLINKGMEVKEAIEFIKNKRPEIHLEDVQIKSLEKFAKK
jgi:protein-tyrosine phosphatase